MARNERGAGRKPALSAHQVSQLRSRHEAGETVTALAKEYNISRQVLSGYLNQSNEKEKENYSTVKSWERLNRVFDDIKPTDYTIRMEYMCKEDCCSIILINAEEKKVKVVNETDNILHRAFGIKAKPNWEDFEEFLQSRCFPEDREDIEVILEDLKLDEYDPLAIVERTEGRMAEDLQWIKIRHFKL
ncbi:MAG: helix-turn-helix domain-containing protein [Bacillus sp. (in: Bacteria)]|nr:helix-turn-helix domain-containing protein [Bacillus sp. (in: firmicutes)]MCM1427980.1 helix-turn-helix domain-containing protein [Eubacterium sp.]